MTQILLIVLFGTLIGLTLGSVGAGGSILAVPVLVYVAGETPKLATVSSLVVVCVTASIAVRPHWVVGRVRTDIAVPFGVVGVLGSLLGKVLSERLNPNMLMLAFSGVMIVAAVVTARRNHVPAVMTVGAHAASCGEDSGGTMVVVRKQAAPVQMGRVVGAGVVVGLMTGFFGVGGGFVIVPALVILLGLPMTEAVGTSLLIIAINSAAAFGLKAKGVSLDWPLISMFTVASVVGAVAGGRISRRFDGATLSRWFVRMVVGVAVYTAARSISGLLG